MKKQPAITAWLPWSSACQSPEGHPVGIDPGAGSEGRREEASSLKPPNWTPSSDFPYKHPSFLAFLRARARCPPLKYKELHPAPSPLGAGIGLEQRLPRQAGEGWSSPQKEGN